MGLTALALPDVLGIGTETLRFATIEGAFGQGELVVLILAKIVLTALCVGAGFSGGVFSPALLIGSLIGALFWMLASGAGGIPTSGVAVYAIAAMVAVVFSNLVSHRLFGRSLFDIQLARRGMDFSLGRDRAHLAALPVRDLLSEDAVTMTPEDTPETIARRLADRGWRQAFVLDADGKLVGVYSPSDGQQPATLTFEDDTSLADEAAHALHRVGDAVPVVARADGRYLGAVSEADMVTAWLDHVARIREEENAAL